MGRSAWPFSRRHRGRQGSCRGAQLLPWRHILSESALGARAPQTVGLPLQGPVKAAERLTPPTPQTAQTNPWTWEARETGKA
eukprot:552678-Pyramimonas_sp.AAC.1